MGFKRDGNSDNIYLEEELMVQSAEFSDESPPESPSRNQSRGNSWRAQPLDCWERRTILAIVLCFSATIAVATLIRGSGNGKSNISSLRTLEYTLHNGIPSAKQHQRVKVLFPRHSATELIFQNIPEWGEEAILDSLDTVSSLRGWFDRRQAKVLDTTEGVANNKNKVSGKKGIKYMSQTHDEPVDIWIETARTSSSEGNGNSELYIDETEYRIVAENSDGSTRDGDGRSSDSQDYIKGSATTYSNGAANQSLRLRFKGQSASRLDQNVER